jgi:predicted hotdog family 3-hydroxylacyl-ACP dehydratase
MLVSSSAMHADFEMMNIHMPLMDTASGEWPLMNIASLSIEDILFHRGTMLLVDRALHFENDFAVAEAIPCAQRWYRNSAGNMPAWLGLELMAQTTSIHMSLKKKQHNLPVKMGALLGTHRYHSAVADFLAGEPLCIRAQVVMLDASGLGVYDCTITRREEVIATATLKVFEPEDFALFMKENTP